MKPWEERRMPSGGARRRDRRWIDERNPHDREDEMDTHDQSRNWSKELLVSSIDKILTNLLSAYSRTNTYVKTYHEWNMSVPWIKIFLLAISAISKNSKSSLARNPEKPVIITPGANVVYEPSALTRTRQTHRQWKSRFSYCFPTKQTFHKSTEFKSMRKCI